MIYKMGVGLGGREGGLRQEFLGVLLGGCDFSDIYLTLLLLSMFSSADNDTLTICY